MKSLCVPVVAVPVVMLPSLSVAKDAPGGQANDKLTYVCAKDLETEEDMLSWKRPFSLGKCPRNPYVVSRQFHEEVGSGNKEENRTLSTYP